MLTRQGVINESTHFEAIPINLVATEDGRTLLAVTEHKDGVLEIVATPVTFIGQSGSSTSLPVFQINVEDLANESELQQSTQHFEAEPNNIDRTKGQSILELKCKKAGDREERSVRPTDTSVNETCDGSVGQKVTTESTKAKNLGRPKKGSAAFSQGTEQLICDICHLEFVKQTTYRKHMESHAEEKPHRCPKCAASFNVPTNFTLHMATHNTGEPKCPECGRKFARMASLKSHILLHEKEENLFCTECEDGFSTKAQLDVHLKLHGEKWTTEEIRKCKLCNKQFTQPALYRLHIREHYKLQTKIVKQTKKGIKHRTMYKCTICLKTFQKPSQLMRHIRVHTGEKPFKCTVCGRAFTQKSSLQIHTWQHNGIRPHACELCNARFSQKGNLNAHIMRVHNVPEGEPIYGCTYCSCVFKKLGSLNGHMKRMHTDVINEEPIAMDDAQSDTTESNMRATVDSVITELASLESNTDDTVKSSNFESVTLSQNMTKKDILQQALKNIGLSNKTKNALEGTFEQKRLEARTNLVTLLDRAPDGGTRKYLTIRQRCVGNIRWYACNFCHKEFKKPSDLIRHLRVHTQEKPFKCTYCYRSFALKSTMIAHERTHSSNKRYACDSCDKTFACHGSLIVHTRLHRKSCEHSEKSIDNDKMINAHNINNIANTCVTSQRRVQAKGKTKLSAEAENLIPQVVLQEPLVISDAGNKICVAQIPSKEKRSHDTTADPARPHKCRICQAAFRKVSHLKQHHRRHTGERPYKCTKCDRRFTSNSVLKSHLHTHEDSRPFGCSICNAKFSTQSSMKRHLVTHSNRRPFMCPYCHKTFKTYVNCRKHMKIHKHELAQRQFEEQKLKVQEHDVETLNLTESSTENPTSDSPYRPSVLVTPIASTSTSSIPVTTTTTSIVSSNNTATSSTTYSDNLALSRIGSVEISFQPQLSSEFSQELQAEFQGISGEKQKVRSALSGNCDAATFINQDGAEITVTNLEDAQVLHADEGNSVTLPVYTGDHALTAESIREIEETLNQQFFNIGMNINLESTARHSHGANTVGFDSAKEQQPILSVIYENNNSNNSNSAEPSGQHVFSSQLDSFEMDHIALQSDADIDIGLHTSHSTSMASMASILPRRVKEEHRLSVSLTTPNNVNTDVCERSNMQAVVFVSQHNFSEKENTENELRIEDVHKSTIEEQCINNPIFLTDDFRGTSGDVQQHPNAPATDVEKMIKTPLSKIPQEESLLECHMCSQQGFTTIGLKEHLSCHRGIKEYQCTECFSRFCTNGGLNRHLKMHVARESLKCPLCERCFNDRIQLRSHNKIHETGLWNALSPRVDSVAENSAISSEMQPVINGNSSLNDIVIDSDASVSEKVLLDTVAEKEIMSRVQNVLVDRTERKEYTNKCKYCPKTFRKPSDLIRHIRTHTGERPYKCDYCNKSFAVKCTLDSHTKVHTGKKTFRCHVCNSLFATKGSLKVHMRLHTGSKPFRCQICDSRFRTSGHRKVHLLKHAREYKDNPKRRQKHSKIAAVAEVAAGLEKCDDNLERTSGYEPEHLQREDFSEIATGYTHLETISIDKNVSCLSDPINFDADEIVSNNGQTMLSMNESNQLVTNLHFLLANGLVTIQSEESLLAQSQMSVSNSHQRSSIIPDSENLHITQNESTDIGDNETTGETVPVDQMLKAQPAILTVAGSSTQPGPLTKISVENSSSIMPDKPITKGNSSKECDICGKIFSKPYQVERHKRIHTGERPYKCDLCTKSFAQKSTLQMHQKHHTGDRPYACLYCEYSFTQKGNLRTHVKRVHQLDTVDLKRRKCVGQSFLTRTSPHENVIETKSPSMEDISFVEFLKE